MALVGWEVHETLDKAGRACAVREEMGASEL
jgi:hypothetical protein